jgi:hypothetical protein
MKRNLKTLRHIRKRSLYTDGRKLDGEPPMHSRSMVKNLYNRDIVSRRLLRRSDDGLPRSHDDRRSAT